MYFTVIDLHAYGTRGSEREFVSDTDNTPVHRLFTVGKGRQNSSVIVQTKESLADKILVAGKGRQ
jgi:hypothetical protein